jgi:hypothetical protein
MTEPIKGKHYRKNGFEFRVDLVENGKVYLVRWPLQPRKEESLLGYAMKVTVEVWNEQMQEAEITQ